MTTGINKDHRIGRLLLLVGSVCLAAAILGCVRGIPSKKPPIHLIPDMDNQPKFKPQSENDFFPDSAAMRPLVLGTVAQGWLHADVIFNTGKDPSTGDFVRESPVGITLTGLMRGQERFNIFCSVCHSRLGDGKGIMVQHGYPPPPNYHDQTIREYPDGHIFDVISNGIRNMPSYAQQIPAEDRWKIVGYVRALQRSEHASLEDVPSEMRTDLK
jgi:hypothetical protein